MSRSLPKETLKFRKNLFAATTQTDRTIGFVKSYRCNYLHSRKVRGVDNRHATGVAEEFSRSAAVLAARSILNRVQYRAIADAEISKRRFVDLALFPLQLQQPLVLAVVADVVDAAVLTADDASRRVLGHRNGGNVAHRVCSIHLTAIMTKIIIVQLRRISAKEFAGDLPSRARQT